MKLSGIDGGKKQSRVSRESGPCQCMGYVCGRKARVTGALQGVLVGAYAQQMAKIQLGSTRVELCASLLESASEVCGSEIIK